MHVGYHILRSELLVQVVKINCKVSGPGRGDVSLNGDARMITLVSVEWS